MKRIFSGVGVLVGLALIVVILTLSLTQGAKAAPPYDLGISVMPAAPDTKDYVEVTVSGWWGTPCYDIIEQYHIVSGSTITIIATIVDLPVVCIQVVSPWAFTEHIGYLPAGEYTVHAYVNDEFVSMTFSVGTTGTVVSVHAPQEVLEDSDFTATINISDVQNFDNVNYDLSFDPSVIQLTDITNGNIGGTEIPVDIWIEQSPGTYVVVQGVPGNPGVSGSGYLATLHFLVVGSPGDSSDITLSNGIIADNQAFEIPATWVGGSVSVIPCIVGDCNGDGVVNALDITCVERIIAGLDQPSGPCALCPPLVPVNAICITKIERIIAGLD